jgi:integrase
MHAALSVLFTFAVKRRKVASNPTSGLWHPEAPEARDRVLTDADIKVFWLATDKIPVPFGAVLKLLLLTGCRANEVNGMRWSELGADGVWIIPGVRTKNHRPHAVPLSPLAQSIISQVPRLESDFVFTTTGTSPISGWSKIKHALDEKMKVEPWRVHDLRRTAASGMQRLGIRTEVIERALNHVSGSFGGVTGIYQRDPLTEEVQTALLRWSQHIAGLVANKGKIVNMPQKRKRVSS